MRTVQQLLQYSHILQRNANLSRAIADNCIKEAESIMLQDANTTEYVNGCTYNPN